MDTSSSPQLSPPPVVETLPEPEAHLSLPEQATSAHSSLKGIMMLTIAALLGVVIIGGGWYITTRMPSLDKIPSYGIEEVEQTGKMAPSPETSPAETPAQVGNTYTNAAGQFQLTLPEGWGATNGSETAFIIAPDAVIQKASTPEGSNMPTGTWSVSEARVMYALDIQNLPDSDPNLEAVQESIVVIDGVQAQKLVKTLKQDSPLGVVGDVITTYTIPLKDQQTFLRISLLDDQYSQQFEQIVASFMYIR